MRFFRFASISILGAVFAARPALAALTDSEKVIVRTFVEKGTLDSAGRVRALVARPDLSAAEIAEPLRLGYASAPFDDAHRRFTDALLFGQGSSAARNALVPAVVEGLLARAAARMAEVPVDASGHPDRHGREASDEIVAIHGYIDAHIANAGSPPPDGHDASTAIRDDALRAAAAVYQSHIAAHERWFRASGSAPPELVRVRAQAELSLIDLSRGVSGRYEVSQWLGLSGARRGIFERRGVLVESDDPTQDAALAPAIHLLESVPRATEGLSLWLLSNASAVSLLGRGRVDRVEFPSVEPPRARAPSGPTT